MNYFDVCNKLTADSLLKPVQEDKNFILLTTTTLAKPLQIDAPKLDHIRCLLRGGEVRGGKRCDGKGETDVRGLG